MQAETDSKKGRLWAKGSGGYGCLLNNDDKDSQHFLDLGCALEVKQLDLTSSLVMVVTPKGDLLVWGSNDKDVMRKPIMLLESVDRISCGW